MSPTDTTATAVAPISAPLEVEQRKPLWEERLTKVFWVNSVAISRDGTRVVAGTYIHDYDQKIEKGRPNIQSRFGVYFFADVPKVQTPKVDPKWSDEFDSWDGVYGVAISGDGKIVAASGWLEKSTYSQLGLLRAYDADSATAASDPLLDYRGIRQRVSWVSLSDDGRVLAAVADDVYVFIRNGAKFNPVPVKLGVEAVAKRYVTGIAVHPTGNWVAACDNSGHVHVAKIANGAVERQVTWTAPKEYPFLSVAIAADAGTFVVGGGNLVFLFDLEKLIAAGPAYTPAAEFDTAKDEANVPGDKDDGRLQENVRWVATSADGTLVTVAVNRNGLTGKLFARNGDLTKRWEETIGNSPNSTSIDSAGRFVAMADGWPTSKPAKFHLFNASDGKKRWESSTCSMNWPIVVNTDGDAIVAGSDDGTVYYFAP